MVKVAKAAGVYIGIPLLLGVAMLLLTRLSAESIPSVFRIGLTAAPLLAILILALRSPGLPHFEAVAGPRHGFDPGSLISCLKHPAASILGGIVVLLAFVLPLAALAIKALLWTLGNEPFRSWHPVLFSLIVAALFVVRLIGPDRAPTWKKLSAVWLKVPKLGGATIVGVSAFALLGFVEPLKAAAQGSPYLNRPLVGWMFIAAAGLVLVAHLFVYLGQIGEIDEDSDRPAGYFYPAFYTAISSNVLVFALLMSTLVILASADYSAAPAGEAAGQPPGAAADG